MGFKGFVTGSIGRVASVASVGTAGAIDVAIQLLYSQPDTMALFINANTANLSSHAHAFRAAELSEVKKAYREKARIYHPDVCSPGEKEKSSEMFLLVQEAYEILSDPMLRANYDLKLLLNPQLLLSQKRNVKQQNWAEQIESLKMRSSSSERKTWGGRMRRSRE
ncbi:chaperone protein dnaJ 20, chloroplastic-like [Cryptomeria japonica]|uniref:chaperone protein dnaJ 20, chloroplastic-like n=1 Tax=Cryptomeria japonica TaxID=3369 RepID=UPI0027DA97B6|nr:chaperone protein dnaJ 20, chloroplastic-like [Cryptomeria japonica]